MRRWVVVVGAVMLTSGWGVCEYAKADAASPSRATRIDNWSQKGHAGTFTGGVVVMAIGAALIGFGEDSSLAIRSRSVMMG